MNSKLSLWAGAWAAALLMSWAAQCRAAPGTAVDSTAAPAGNGFNPDISLILSGRYAHLSRDPSSWRLTGFIPGGEIGPGERGLSLAESELGIYANIDPWFYGGLNVSIAADNSVSAEEAFVQTTSLGNGVRVKAGRFFSGLGYLNEQHSHTWDFVDAPLAYQAFLGGQFGQEGLQAKWLLPTDRFIEFGAELGRGRDFPATDSNRNRAGATAAFVHTGGDIGVSQSWRAGVSALWAQPADRTYEDGDLAGNTVSNSFSGHSRLWLADAVWKWAPGGNATRTSLKLQAEYFHRTESGTLVYDTQGLSLADVYRSAQSGWYLQSIYQFMPAWRIGLRGERLDVGRVDYFANSAYLAAPDYSPAKLTGMIDWSPSEFSRVRLQIARDKSHQGQADNQFFIQYQMSLGAHGAHSF